MPYPPIPERIIIGPQDRVFVLTGAGISAESGIPTFRASDGLWAGHRVEDVCTPEAWQKDPQLVWQFYAERRVTAAASLPNPAHLALAKLEEAIGDRFFLCTQNVDDLHERAGSKRVVHMHGELFQSRCEDGCGEPPFTDREQYRSLVNVPRCACGARVRPHIVWFGEIPLEMDRIMAEIQRCTVLLVVGTSGAVHPAASFVHWANQRARLTGTEVRSCYVGPERPLNATSFTRIFLGKAGKQLPALFEVVHPSACVDGGNEEDPVIQPL